MLNTCSGRSDRPSHQREAVIFEKEQKLPGGNGENIPGQGRTRAKALWQEGAWQQEGLAHVAGSTTPAGNSVQKSGFDWGGAGVILIYEFWKNVI